MAALVLFIPRAGLSQEPEWRRAMADCAGITDNSERLACFDSLSRGVAALAKVTSKPPVEPAAEDSLVPGQWKVDVHTDPFNDTKTVALALIGKEQRAKLVLRCKQNKPEVYLSWGKYLAPDPIAVLTRLGSAKAETKKWPLSSDKKAAFFAGDKNDFVRELLSVDRLLAQVTPFGENPATDVFDVSGLSGVIAPFREACRLP